MDIFASTYKLFIAVSIGIFSASAALAESPFLEKGIAAYTRGNYAEAIGMFGAAKSTESDNPTMHYYMANCLVKLGSKPDAIREYKMALAISPTGQISQYCTAALRSLGALPAVAVAPAVTPVVTPMATPADQDRMKRLRAPKFMMGSQQPQVVSVLCGCPLCHRLDMIITDLHTNLGDKIGFIRTMQNAPDERTKDILNKYPVQKCPTVMIFNSQGELAHTYTGVISETDLTRDLTSMANASPSTHFASPQDVHLAGIRNSIVGEVDARVASDQIRVDDEIAKIQTDMDEQINSMPRYRNYRGSTAAADREQAVLEIKTEGNKRIKVIQDTFEQKKKDWYAAAATTKFERCNQLKLQFRRIRRQRTDRGKWFTVSDLF